MLMENHPDNDQEIHVGVLFSQSGNMAVTEAALLKGTLIAIDEINGAGGEDGKKLVPHIEDPASDPSIYCELANKLLAREQVVALFGCCSSASRKAILPLVERHGGILFYPSVYEGFEYSPNVVYTGATPSQTIVPLLEYLIHHYGRQFFLAGSDFIFSREVNRITKEFLLESGCTVLGEEYVGFGAPSQHFDRIAARVAESKPDVILSTVVGGDTARFLQANHRRNARNRPTPIASLTATEGEIESLPPQMRAGHLTVAPYFNSIDSPSNRRFVELYQRRYGQQSRPSVYSETAYFQVHLFWQAHARAGSSDPALVLAALRGLQLEAPHGQVQVEPENNHVFLQPRIGRSREDGSFDIVWEAPDIVAPDPYLVAYDRKIS